MGPAAKAAQIAKSPTVSVACVAWHTVSLGTLAQTALSRAGGSCGEPQLRTQRFPTQQIII